MTKRRNRFEGADPGPIVRIDGRNYVTILDECGTQRFPANRIIRDLYLSGAINANAISRLYQEGVYHLEEVQQLDRLFGFTMQGYMDAHPGLDFENPLWDTDETT